MDQNGAQLFQPAAAVPQLPIHTTQREHSGPGIRSLLKDVDMDTFSNRELLLETQI